MHIEPIRMVLWERKWEEGEQKTGLKGNQCNEESKTSAGRLGASGDADGDGGCHHVDPPSPLRSTKTQSKPTDTLHPCLGVLCGQRLGH